MLVSRQIMARRLASAAAAIALFAALAACALPRALAQTPPVYTDIYNFPAVDGTRAQYAPIVASNGDIYYASSTGGKYGDGTVCRVNPSGRIVVVHAFTGKADGSSPQCSLVQVGTKLYGTTFGGGSGRAGTVFTINLVNDVFRSVHQFSEVNSQGLAPLGGLTLGSDGYLYGVCEAGGAHGWGTIYRVSAVGIVKLEYSFRDRADGGLPSGPPYRDAAGNLIAVAAGGSGANGVLVSISPRGAATVLHSFSGTDGSNLIGGVVPDGSGGTIGAAMFGAANDAGDIYDVGPAGSTFTVLHSFDPAGADGGYPAAPPVAGPNGEFYGTSSFAGPGECGALYSITASGSFSVLHILGPDEGDGEGISLGSSGSICGIAVYDNERNSTVYTSSLTGTVTDVAHSAPEVGVPDTNGLTQVSPGLFIGCGFSGGIEGAGTVYSVTATGLAKTLHSFKFATGAEPRCNLVLGPGGYYYGTLSLGGPAYDPAAGNMGDGAVFRIKVDGSGFAIIHSFSYSDGSVPTSSLTVGSDNALYGGTSRGGAYGAGTAFRVTPSGKYDLLHSFDGIDGNGPSSALVEVAPDEFAGATGSGGQFGSGNLYELSAAGAFQILHNFDPPTDGSSPFGTLAYSGGVIFGSAVIGGADAYGTLYACAVSGSSAGLFSILHTFTGGADGGNPESGVLLASDGNLYCPATTGGAYHDGCVFESNPQGTSSSTLISYGQANMNSGFCVPTEGSDGNLYSTTPEGGPAGIGTVFELKTKLPVP